MRRGKHFWQVWWGYLAEPRRVTAAMTFGYALLIFQGTMNYIQPGIEGVDIDFIRLVINMMLILGGLMGVIFCPRGYWLFEKPAMLLIATAYIVHLIWVVFDFDHDGIVEQGKIVRILLVLILLYTRFERIKGSLVDPLKS